MRECPRCAFPLEVVEKENRKLDYCRRCGGTFFDPGEEPALFGAPVSPDIWKDSSVARRHRTPTLRCPEDHTQLVRYVVEFEDKNVEIDVCQKCAGMWHSKTYTYNNR